MPRRGLGVSLGLLLEVLRVLNNFEYEFGHGDEGVLLFAAVGLEALVEKVNGVLGHHEHVLGLVVIHCQNIVVVAVAVDGLDHRREVVVEEVTQKNAGVVRRYDLDVNLASLLLHGGHVFPIFESDQFPFNLLLFCGINRSAFLRLLFFPF